MTRADPRVGDYPFTTLEPSLGTIELDGRQLVIADIPGLIEGAAQGAGLGHEFLAHVERCRLLVHLVEVAPPEGEPQPNHAAVRAELAEHGGGLEELPEIVALSKADLLPPEDAEGRVEEWRAGLGEPATEVMAISSATRLGLDELVRRLFASLPEAPGVGRRTAAEAIPAGHRTYRPGDEDGFAVRSDSEGRWLISGRGIEMLVERHDLANEEALDYLEARLREIGVVAELERAGFEPGDEVVIGGEAFEFHPG